MSSDKVENNVKCVKDTEDDIVNPWNVVSKSDTGIDYDKLISEYIHMVVKIIVYHCNVLQRDLVAKVLMQNF